MEQLGLGATFRQEKEGTEGRSNIHQERKELVVWFVAEINILIRVQARCEGVSRDDISKNNEAVIP